MFIRRACLFAFCCMFAIPLVGHAAEEEGRLDLGKAITLGMIMKPYFGGTYTLLTVPIKPDVSKNQYNIKNTEQDHGHFGVHAGLRVHRYFGVQVGYNHMASIVTVQSQGIAYRGLLKMKQISADLRLYSPITENDYFSVELSANLGGSYILQDKITFAVAPDQDTTTGMPQLNGVSAVHGPIPKVGIGLQVGFLGMIAAHVGVDMLFFTPQTPLNVRTVAYFNAGVSLYLF